MAAVAATAAMVAAAAISAEPSSGKQKARDSDDGAPPPPTAAALSPTPTTQQPRRALAPATKPSSKDLLDTTVLYLKQREGIDKTLKIIRYTARLVAAATPTHPSPFFPLSASAAAELRSRADNVQAALGSARKAYRLGKFLQHASAWRRLPPIDWRRCISDSAYRLSRKDDLLERGQVAGEGCYYFCDQLAFYFKAGAFGEAARKGATQKRLSLLSAWAETLGYACNIALGLKRVRELQGAEARLRAELVAKYRASGGSAAPDPRAVERLRALGAARRLRTAVIAQDAADALLALSDLLPEPPKGGGGDGGGGLVGRVQRGLAHPVLLALCGLLSAGVSTHKNWSAVAGG
jgi:hypothetical protein